LNEFATGTIDGTLSIYKDKRATPKWKSTNLGTISALAFGNICKSHNSDLIVLTSEGWIYLFKYYNNMPLFSNKQGCESTCIDLHYFKKQLLLPNARMAIVCDTNGDGDNELIVSYADRRVRVFRYVEHESESDKVNKSGKFVTIAHWTLDGQIGTISINLGEHGKKQLIASQPGATFIDLNLAATSEQSTDFVDIFYNPAASVTARFSTSAFTEIIGSLTPIRGSIGTNICIGTTDGLLILMNQNNIIWTEHLESRLIAIDKLDLNGDNVDEILACCENGTLYIINSQKEICQFRFNDRVANFCSGQYGIDGQNKQALVFFTFRHKIVMFNDMDIGSPQIEDLISKLHENGNKDILKGVLELIDGEATRSKIAEVISRLLYFTKSN
ncbi:hypothetical protein GJ496_004204, partial [Pomphorhynchus laevis]